MGNDVPNLRGVEHGDGVRIGLPLASLLITLGSILVAVTWQAGKFAEVKELRTTQDVMWAHKLEIDHNADELRHLRERLLGQFEAIRESITKIYPRIEKSGGVDQFLVRKFCEQLIELARSCEDLEQGTAIHFGQRKNGGG